MERISVAASGTSVQSQPMPIGAVIATSYRAETRWSPRLLEGSQALVPLFKTAAGLRSAPKFTIATITTIASRSPVYFGERGEASEVVKWWLDRDGNSG